MDPLSVLRQFVTQRHLDTVVTVGDRTTFGDSYSFPKSSRTAFRANKGQGDYYTLDQILVYIQHIGSGAAEYIKKCNQNGVQPVLVADRKPLRDYLEGQIDETSLPHIADVAPPVVLLPQDEEPTAKRARVEEAVANSEADELQLLSRQERQLRDRNTMLLTPNRSFEKVLAMMDAAFRHTTSAAAAKQPPQQHYKQQQPQQQRPTQAPPPPARAAPPAISGAAPSDFIKPSGRYERGATKDALIALGASNAATIAQSLGLGMIGSGQQGGAPPPPPPPQHHQQRPPQQAAPAHQPQPRHTQQQQRSSGGGGGHHGQLAPAPGAVHAKRPSSGSSKTSGVPIIIVPAGLSAMLNIYNAKQWLEKGVFIRSDEAARAASGQQKKTQETYVRDVGRQKAVPYVVTDRPPPAGHPDWKRVVAVIVQGKAWQFKDWPFRGADKGDLVSTFSKVFGAYLHFADEPLPDSVKSWAVLRVPLQRESRYLDRTALIEFYKALDAFLAARQCPLHY